MIVIEECSKAKSVTIFVRGGSKMIVAEAERSIHDALCSVRNLIKCNKIVYGGGSCELACALYLQEESNSIDSVE
jgi:T-complex protein 1 subunit epsilon